MRAVLALAVCMPALAFAKAPPSAADVVAQRALPAAPAEVTGRVTCTAVVVVDDEGRTRDVGVAAEDACQGDWAKAARRAVSRWRWPADGAAEGAKGHVTVAWNAAEGATAKAEAVPGLPVLEKQAPAWPEGAARTGKVVCRAMVGVTPAGLPAVAAVDACPSEYQAAAVDALFGWRWQARDDTELAQTWVLVTFE